MWLLSQKATHLLQSRKIWWRCLGPRNLRLGGFRPRCGCAKLARRVARRREWLFSNSLLVFPMFLWPLGDFWFSALVEVVCLKHLKTKHHQMPGRLVLRRLGCQSWGLDRWRVFSLGSSSNPRHSAPKRKGRPEWDKKLGKASLLVWQWVKTPTVPRWTSQVSL